MNVRRLLLLLVALIAAGGTAMVARKFVNSPQATAKVSPEAVAPEPAAEVLVAAKDLPAGTILEKDHLRFRSWPKDGVTEGFVLKGPEADKPFVGAVVRRGVVKGEPLTETRVVKPGERGFLAAIVDPGRRAISVPVNATTGVSGLFFPGDQVDVILTHKVTRGEVERHVSETVMRDVRVLAVDQRVEDINGKAQVAKTATLEVTPKQAEVIAMLSGLGKLSLALRSVGTPEGEDETLDLAEENVLADSFTLDSEVSQVLRAPPKVEGVPQVKVSVIRGGKKQASQQGLSFGIVPLTGAPMGEDEADGAPAKPAGAGVQAGVAEMQEATTSGVNQFGNTLGEVTEGE